jgi:glycosyltransferase involved in cell wall biosynthesis
MTKRRKGNSSVPPCCRRAIIYFSGGNLRAPYWTNRQQIALRLCRRHQLIYIQPRLGFWRELARRWRQPRALLEWLVHLCWYERAGLHLYIVGQTNLLPGSRRFLLVDWLNHWLNVPHLLFICWFLGVWRRKEVAIWTYDTESWRWLRLLRRWPAGYDCVDNHCAQAGLRKFAARVAREERELLRRVQVVTVTSAPLLRLLRKRWRQARGGGAKNAVRLVLNAGDALLYREASLASPSPSSAWRNISRPRLVLVGTLDAYKLDLPLLYAVTRRHPEWSFVFAGRIGLAEPPTDLRRLLALPNVYYMGVLPPRQAAELVAQADVCLIPYRRSDYNAYSFPLKFWEYLAAGKPVVASGLPALAPFRALYYAVSTPAEFAGAVRRALRESADLVSRRRAEAMRHDWNERAETLEKILAELYRGGRRRYT